MQIPNTVYRFSAAAESQIDKQYDIAFGQRSRRVLAIYLALILLAGIFHLLYSFLKIDPFFDTLLFCLSLTIYCGLIMYWLMSLRYRLLPSFPRSCMSCTAVLMLMLMFLRVIKYRLVFRIPALERLCWYSYYLPLLMMPTLFFMCCFGMREQSGSRRIKWLAVMFVPASAMFLIIMTNDFHYLVFRPDPQVAVFTGITGTYSYGAIFYAAYGWMIVCAALGMLILVQTTLHTYDRHSIVFPMTFILLWIVLLILRNVFDSHQIPCLYEFPEISIFCMMGCFESCFQLRLIPYNEHYDRFFRSMRIPAVVTDSEFHPVYHTAEPVQLTGDQMRDALRGPEYLSENVRLGGRGIRFGYVFWSEDERALNQLNDRLEEANETLILENRLISYEQEQKEERARLDARSAVYAWTAMEVYPVQKKIEEILAAAEPGTARFRQEMARASVLNAFVKRKSNFVLSFRDSVEISARELFLALEEMTRFLNYCGVQASATSQSDAVFSYVNALALYDTFEAVTELLMPGVTRLMVFLMDDGLRLTVNGKLPEDLPDLPCTLTADYSDGLLYITIRSMEWAGSEAAGTSAGAGAGSELAGPSADAAAVTGESVTGEPEREAAL